MNIVQKSLVELHRILMIVEQNIHVEPKKEVLMVQKEKGLRSLGLARRSNKRENKLLHFFQRF